MLQTILNFKGVQKLNRTQLQIIKGSGWPRNEEDCLACGGEWSAPLCALSSNSPCA
ncbi:hypothetical protein ATE84_3128 [Aquimarina sp. MAR_2010_214]|uniref:hypothetical protein n=1 Tax=Aquimarina sp. MAR_2010_214 TaxID=1250026 RepID=UPI000CBF72B4|nr:hypothetical protein [Aquimarina sp. MAR_2010_214]PKV51059.1 hypothetical protein ATE84_3128 [Aquimarina sp. MAR_2010_214]